MGFRFSKGNRASRFGVPILVAAGGMVLLLAAGCDRLTPAGESENISNNGASTAQRVQTIEVSRRDLARTIEVPGTVEGMESADLYCKVGGYLEEIHVDIGDRIEKGQKLAALYVPEMLEQLGQKEALVRQAEANVEQAQAAIREAQAEVVSAQAALDEAKTARAEKQAQLRFHQTEYARVQDLVESNSLLRKRLDEAKFQLDAAEAALGTVEAQIRTAEAGLDAARASLEKTRADYESAKASVEVAQANYDSVEIMLQYATIVAPFDGFVTRRMVHPGAFIQPAERNSAAKPLLSVARTDPVRIRLDLPMAEVRFLDKGDSAVFDRINVLPDARFDDGSVTRFAAALDRTSRMMRVEIDLPNPEGKLLPGYYGIVTLYLEEYPETPVVPASAALTDDEGAFVFVVEDGRAVKRRIASNYEDGTIVGIASGLEGGERVVAVGAGQLSDRQEVTAVLASGGSNPGE